MQTTFAHYSRRVLRWLLATMVIILGLHLLLQQVNLNVFHQQNGYFFELSNRFDMDDESSIPTWFSQFLFLLTAISALLAARLEKIRIKRTLWAIISLLGLFLSIDEVAGIHEQVLETIHVLFFHESAPTLLKNAWLIVLPFILLAVLLLGRQMVRQFPRRTLMIMGLGVGVLLTGAIGVDVFTQGLEIPNLTLEFLQQGILVGLEESLELTGSIIILYAIMEYIELHYHKQVISSIQALRQ